MDIHLALHGRHDLAGQIYRQLRAGVMEGRLVAGQRLPSTRKLAISLGVSRKTTLDAFERLITEGYLRTRAGDGTFVADAMTRLAQAPAHPLAQPVSPDTARPPVRPLTIWETLSGAMPMTRPGSPPQFDFVGGVTDKARFPFEAWRRCVNHALREQARGRGEYHDPAGEPALREAVSRYLAFNRAVLTPWQQVFVTQGAQQALDLLARVTVRPGDVIAAEDPGYPPARVLFAATGAQVVPVPVDAQGIVVDALPPNARMVYVTPSHQFPLGMPMEMERRLALLAWAQRHEALIVEDDYDGEFRFEGRPMESLKSLDKADVVAYVGTFSKTIFPELRIGYVVPPAELTAALRYAKQAIDWHSSTMTQVALARFMHDGDFARHLRRMHKMYAARRHALLAHLYGGLSAWLRPLPSAAGIHLVALLRPGLTEDALIARANAASVGLYGISGMYTGQAPQAGLLFGYGGIEVKEINAGLQRLTEVLDGWHT